VSIFSYFFKDAVNISVHTNPDDKMISKECIVNDVEETGRWLLSGVPEDVHGKVNKIVDYLITHTNIFKHTHTHTHIHTHTHTHTHTHIYIYIYIVVVKSYGKFY
jgi:hypothetical protein